MSLLEVEALSIQAAGRTVLEEVSFTVEAQESVALVGASGVGKSLTLKAILGLLPKDWVRGEVRLLGESLLEASPDRMRAIRGQTASMIFQEPRTALNPVMSVGAHLLGVIAAHRKLPKAQRVQLAEEMLHKVGLADPQRRMKSHPHELSGGMRQRVLIAMALVHQPRLLLADEPTSALDATVQAQILELLERLREEQEASVLLVTHDLGVVARSCGRVLVMQAGKIVESGPVEQIFEAPEHPYTKQLLEDRALLAGRPR